MSSWLRRLDQRGRAIAYRMPAPPAIRIIAGLIFRTFRNFSRDDGSHMAAGVAYYGVFSLFPLLLATVAIAGYVVSDPQTQQRLFDVLDGLLPGSGSTGFVQENIEAISAARGALGLFALAGLLWSARAVFGAVHRVVNRAWKVPEPQHFILFQLAQVGAAVAATVLFVGSAVLGTVGRTVASQVDLLPVQVPWAALIAALTFSISTALFMFVYKFIPDAQVRWRDAVPAGLAAGVGFEVAKVAFAYYLATLSSLDLVYGSVTTIVVLMLFLYVVSLILVWGAELSSELKHTDEAGLLDIRGHLRPVAGGLASVPHRPSTAAPDSPPLRNYMHQPEAAPGARAGRGRDHRAGLHERGDSLHRHDPAA